MLFDASAMMQKRRPVAFVPMNSAWYICSLGVSLVGGSSAFGESLGGSADSLRVWPEVARARPRAQSKPAMNQREPREPEREEYMVDPQKVGDRAFPEP